MEATVFIVLQIFFATCAVLKIEEYINNSLHLERKYARIFVHGHYVFREATRTALKIGYSRIFPSFSWGVFDHVTRSDQSRTIENI